jgi:hypothetical protein
MEPDKTRVDKVRYWTAVARLFLESFVQVGVYGGGWIYGGWIWSGVPILLDVAVSR